MQIDRRLGSKRPHLTLRYNSFLSVGQTAAADACKPAQHKQRSGALHKAQQFAPGTQSSLKAPGWRRLCSLASTDCKMGPTPAAPPWMLITVQRAGRRLRRYTGALFEDALAKTKTLPAREHSRLGASMVSLHLCGSLSPDGPLRCFSVPIVFSAWKLI